jgi:hypothetical protein
MERRMRTILGVRRRSAVPKGTINRKNDSFSILTKRLEIVIVVFYHFFGGSVSSVLSRVSEENVLPAVPVW